MAAYLSQAIIYEDNLYWYKGERLSLKAYKEGDYEKGYIIGSYGSLSSRLTGEDMGRPLYRLIKDRKIKTVGFMTMIRHLEKGGIAKLPEWYPTHWIYSHGEGIEVSDLSWNAEYTPTIEEIQAQWILG